MDASGESTDETRPDKFPQGRSFAMTAKFMIDASSVIFSCVEQVKPGMSVIQIYSK